MSQEQPQRPCEDQEELIKYGDVSSIVQDNLVQKVLQVSFSISLKLYFVDLWNLVYVRAWNNPITKVTRTQVVFIRDWHF